MEFIFFTLFNPSSTNHNKAPKYNQKAQFASLFKITFQLLEIEKQNRSFFFTEIQNLQTEQPAEFIQINMKAKVLTAILLIGIATLAGFKNLMISQSDKSMNMQPEIMEIMEEEISSLKKEETTDTEVQMGIHSSKANRKLYGIRNLGGSYGLVGESAGFEGALTQSLSNAAGAAQGAGGFGNFQGNSGASLFGGTGITSASNNGAASSFGGLNTANSFSNGAAAILKGYGLTGSNSNSAANVLGLGGAAAAKGNGAGSIIGGSGQANTLSNSAALNYGGLNMASSLGNSDVINFGGLGLSNAQSNSAVAGLGGFNSANGGANGIAGVFGGKGVASSHTNTAAAILAGLSSSQSHSDSNAIGNTGFATGNGNAAATALGGGYTFGKTDSSAFNFPGLSSSITNANSLAFGKNPAASTNANAASGLFGAGLSSANSNGNAAVLGGLGVAGSLSNAVTASLGGGDSISIAKSDSFAQSFSLPELSGQYQLDFPTVPIIVTQDAFIFKGCSDYRVPIIRQNRNVRYGAMEYQPNDCDYDPAFKLCQRFYQTDRYNREDDGFSGYNSQDNEKLFRVREKKGNKRGKQVHGQFYEGEYEAEQPSRNVEVNSNNLYFQGHRDEPVEFQYKDKGSINFRKHFEKKRNIGIYDKDRSVSDLLVSCDRVKPRAGKKGYDFHDKKGRRIAGCSPKKW